VTWSPGNHSFKFGADFKRLTDHDDNVSATIAPAGMSSTAHRPWAQTIGDPYTAFLLGDPDYTEVSSTNNPTMNGLGYAYAFFGQDDWKITPNLTLNLGLRYELHPPIHETHYNTATFQPDYSASSGGQPVHGAVVSPMRRLNRTLRLRLSRASRPRRSSRRAGRHSARASLYRHGPTGVRAWALRGGLMATTRPCCAAAGDDSLSRRSAFRWSPAGPSTPAMWPHTTRAINPTA
jgi:hypothetical protein